jgi:sortase A
LLAPALWLYYSNREKFGRRRIRDLNKLEKGDEFYITDSEGRKYTYKVFNKFIASPENLSVLAPVDGKNIVTLQTCTLPDYTSRLLVRGELQGITES